MGTELLSLKNSWISLCSNRSKIFPQIGSKKIGTGTKFFFFPYKESIPFLKQELIIELHCVKSVRI